MRIPSIVCLHGRRKPSRAFCGRLRSLRNVEGFSIEEGEWPGRGFGKLLGRGRTERARALLGRHHGLRQRARHTAAVLFSFHKQSDQDETRKNLDTLLDLCSPKEIQLLIRSQI